MFFNPVASHHILFNTPVLDTLNPKMNDCFQLGTGQITNKRVSILKKHFISKLKIPS